MSKAYPKYKPSGVEWLGDVPEHWKIKRLKYCAPLVTTKAGSSGSNPIALENIESWTGRFLETESEFEGEGIRFQKDDVLFGKLRPYLAKVYLAEKNGESVGDIFVLRPAKETASKYLSNALRTDNYIEIIDGSTYGSKMPRASWEFMGCLPFLLPPLPEQQAIAAFLDRETGRIDALITKKERLLELLAEQRTALISRAVTKGLDASVKLKPSGVEWLGDVPEHWEVKKLKFIGTALIGLTYSPDEVVDEDFSGKKHLVLRSTNIQDGKISLHDNVYVTTPVHKELEIRKGDILICARNGSRHLVGKNALVSETNTNMTFGAFTTVYRSNINRFLFYFFSSSQFQYQSTGFLTTTINQLTNGNLNSILTTLPPLPEQQAIAAFLDRETAKIDALSAKLSTVIERLKEYRIALISSAVTGKIDVREAV